VSPHLPAGHLSIVEVRVVVPLDGGEVGVEGEEGGGQETLLLRPIDAGGDGDVAELVHYLVGLPKGGVVGTQEFTCISIVEFHRDTARGMTVTCSVDKLHSVILVHVAPAGGALPHTAVVGHVQHLEV